LGLVSKRDHITRLSSIRRDVETFTIDEDMTMFNDLACFWAGTAKASTVNYVIQTAFEDLQECLTCNALTTRHFLILAVELYSKNRHTEPEYLAISMDTSCYKYTLMLKVSVLSQEEK
jgi:hypothetical protein